MIKAGKKGRAQAANIEREKRKDKKRCEPVLNYLVCSWISRERYIQL